jgi:hypothetical protein
MAQKDTFQLRFAVLAIGTAAASFAEDPKYPR